MSKDKQEKVTRLLHLRSMTVPEAVAYMRKKNGSKITYHFHEMAAQEHDDAFTVSRLAKLDILNELHDSLVKVSASEMGRKAWIDSARKTLQEKGWWGKKEVTNPETSEVVRTVFTHARLRLIYENNTRRARMTAEWERIQRSKRSFPYLRYVTMDDSHVRRLHKHWHGVTLHVNHSFWHTHYPPNGHRCRCTVESISRKEYEQGKARTGEPLNTSEPDVVLRKYLNRTTGKVEMIPAGIDPGFAYNPGIARGSALQELAQQKLNKAQPELAKGIIAEMVASTAFANWLKKPHGSWPLATLPAEDLGRIGAQKGVNTAVLSADTARKQAKHHPEVTQEDYALAQKVIDTAESKTQESANKLKYVLKRKGYTLIVKATKVGDELFIVSLRRSKKEKGDT